MERKVLGLVKRHRGNKQKTKRSFFGMSRHEEEALLKEAADEAIAKTHAAGLPTTHGDEKGVYRLYPDGRKEYIKWYTKYDPPE
jgi:hypothetical protein